MEKEKPGILKQELLDNAPGMSKAPKDNPFEVPEDYFSRLPEKIAELKNSRTRKSRHTIFSYSTSKIMAYAAAIAVLIAFSLSVLFFIQKDDINDFAGIDEEYLESYFSYLAEYDEAYYYEILISEESNMLNDIDGYTDISIMMEDTDDDTYLDYILEYMDTYHYFPEDIEYILDPD